MGGGGVDVPPVSLALFSVSVCTNIKMMFVQTPERDAVSVFKMIDGDLPFFTQF